MDDPSTCCRIHFFTSPNRHRYSLLHAPGKLEKTLSGMILHLACRNGPHVHFFRLRARWRLRVAKDAIARAKQEPPAVLRSRQSSSRIVTRQTLDCTPCRRTRDDATSRSRCRTWTSGSAARRMSRDSEIAWFELRVWRTVECRPGVGTCSGLHGYNELLTNLGPSPLFTFNLHRW